MVEPVVTYLEQGDQEAQTAALGKAQHLRPRLWAREYSCVGDARGTIAITHDHAEHGGRYSKFGGRFAEGGWAVTVFDFRGHGDSDGERDGRFHSAADLVDDVDLALQHVAFLLPEAPRVVLGTGLGALAAMGYALQHPDRCAGFVAINPDIAPGPAFKKGGLLSGLFGGGTLQLDPAERFRDAAKAAAFANDKKLTMKRDGKTAAAVDELRKLVRDGAGNLKRPGLVVISKGDRVADPASTRDFCKRAGAQVELLETDLGHAVIDDADSEKAIGPVFAWLEKRFPRGVNKEHRL